MLPSMKFVEPIRRTLDSKFKFRCHKDISCFTKCCSRTDIILTPYDIFRMRKRLGISSKEFLDKYTSIYIDEKSSQPYAILKMTEPEMKCPFVTSEGCIIYEDRPSNCRYYPVGQGLMIRGADTGPVNEEFYFFIRDPNCLGYYEDVEWTIETWRVDQGVVIYDEMNMEWKEIQLRRNARGQPKLEPKKQSLVYMVSYDLENFKRFIFESRFLTLFDIVEEKLEKIRTDEIALMKFGFEYLKYILMLEETLKIKEEYKKGL